jgi:hypothetical protein
MAKRKKAKLSKNSRAEKTYLGTIITVFIIAILVALVAVSIKNAPISIHRQAVIGQLQKPQAQQAAIKVTLSYVGEIQAIDKDKSGFSILALAQKNKLLQDKVVQVKVTKQTVYQQTIENELTEINFKDLRTGDLVVAFSNNDVANLLDMEAATVQKIR